MRCCHAGNGLTGTPQLLPTSHLHVRHSSLCIRALTGYNSAHPVGACHLLLLFCRTASCVARATRCADFKAQLLTLHRELVANVLELVAVLVDKPSLWARQVRLQVVCRYLCMHNGHVRCALLRCPVTNAACGRSRCAAGRPGG